MPAQPFNNSTVTTGMDVTSKSVKIDSLVLVLQEVAEVDSVEDSGVVEAMEVVSNLEVDSVVDVVALEEEEASVEGTVEQAAMVEEAQVAQEDLNQAVVNLWHLTHSPILLLEAETRATPST